MGETVRDFSLPLGSRLWKGHSHGVNHSQIPCPAKRFRGIVGGEGILAHSAKRHRRTYLPNDAATSKELSAKTSANELT